MSLFFSESKSKRRVKIHPISLREGNLSKEMLSIFPLKFLDWFNSRRVQNCKISMSRLSIVTLLLYAEYIMQNARLDEAQAGIKFSGRNINNLRYADDTTLMTQRKEIESLLMRTKGESEKAGLKLNYQKTKVVASDPITSWQIDGEKVETVRDFYLLGLQNHCGWWLQPWNEKMLPPWRKSYVQPRQHMKKVETLPCQRKSI